MATRDDAVMVVQSFSKSYCMTGWRVGWLVARRDLAAKATQLNEFIVSHAPSFAQKAGETALAEGEEAAGRMLERLQREPRSLPGGAARHARRDGAQARRRVLPVPADRREWTIPSRSAGGCWRKPGWGWRPGVAFGAGGEGSVRICYAAERSILEPAMERLTKFLRALAKKGTDAFI